MINYLISLDLSTTCTGYAIFDITTKNLVTSGRIKVKAPKKIHNYPYSTHLKLTEFSIKIKELINEYEPHVGTILVEEINRHKSRLSGKTLDGLHWYVVNSLTDDQIKKIRYCDSDGATGWRSALGLTLSEEDKKENKFTKSLNRKNKGKKIKVINKKDLAQRIVNSVFDKEFNVVTNATDSDEVDAIGLGYAYLNFIKP